MAENQISTIFEKKSRLGAVYCAKESAGHHMLSRTSAIRLSFYKDCLKRFVLSFRPRSCCALYKDFNHRCKQASASFSDRVKMFAQWMIMWHLQGMHPEEYFVLGGLSTSFRCKFNAVTRWRQMYFQKKVNTYQSRHSLDSKVAFNQLFADLLHREWRSFDAIDLEAFLERHGKAIAKPLAGSGGKSIEFVDWRNFSVKQKAEFLKQIKQSKNHIIEEVLTQTGFAHQVHPSSVNTLRVNTLKYDNKVVCLGTFFRTGRAGEIIDNLHAGGIFWQLNSHSGEVIFGTDSEGHYFSTHPDTGIVLSGAFIPKHQEAIEMCLNIHERVPAIPQVGWDLAISESSIALIEANSQSGFWNMDEEGAVWRELKAFMFNLK